MGKIEDIIYENYKKAISEGDFDQAKRAVELGKVLKTKVETEDFVDYGSLKVPVTSVLGTHFNPFPYKYDSLKGLVELSSSSIVLSEIENKLFGLFSQNETQGKFIKIVTKVQIARHLWGRETYSSSAIRINILRLRRKIEPDFKNPQVLLNIPYRGYIFLGNKIESL